MSVTPISTTCLCAASTALRGTSNSGTTTALGRRSTHVGTSPAVVPPDTMAPPPLVALL